MMRKKSNPKRRVAAVAIPLSACAAVLLLTQPVVARVVDLLASVEIPVFANKINENDQTLQIDEIRDEFVSGESSHISVIPSQLAVQATESAGYSTEFFEDNGLEAIEKKNDVSKLTYFIDGKVFKGDISEIDPSNIASMKIVKNDPAYPNSKVMIVTKSAETSVEKVPTEVEKIAQFKGGEKELLAFLIENIKYPSANTDYTDQPIRVVLSFNILTDGTVGDIQVRKSGGEAFDAEAIEVVSKTSGRWEPAEENGKPVVSQFTIPIIFKKS